MNDNFQIFSSLIRKRIFSFVLISLLILVGVPFIFDFSSEYPTVDAKTIIVDKNGGGNYTTIQEAIDNANPGDTINIWTGIYYENIIINKKLNLIGNGTNNTTIEGSGMLDVIQITSDWVNLSYIYAKDGGKAIYHAGIELLNSDHCKIENCMAAVNAQGIRLISSSNNLIKNNNFTENQQNGIYAENSNFNKIINNICRKNHLSGIYIYLSSNNIIINNTCFINNVNDGMSFSKSTFNKVTNNNCYNNGRHGTFLYISSNNKFINNSYNLNENDGIQLYFSSTNEFYNNTLNEGGIFIIGNQLTHWDTHTITINNTANNKPIYFWKNKNGGTVPANAGQIILVNCTMVNVKNQNLSNVSVGIELVYSNDNNISNNTCNNNNFSGIHLFHSSNELIMNNNCNFSSKNGMFLEHSSNNELINNTCKLNNYKGVYNYYSSNCSFINNTIVSNNDDGLFQSGSSNNTYLNNYCSNNYIGIYITCSSSSTVINNTCVDNTYGIQIASTTTNQLFNISSNNCSDNLIGIKFQGASNSLINNNICLNNGYGISLHSSSNNNNLFNNYCLNNTCGIRIGISSSNKVKNNTLNFNEHGIWVGDSTYNLFQNNICILNTHSGIYLEDSAWNTIYNNNCSKNDYGICLYYSGSNKIYNNSIYTNEWVGITLGSSGSEIVDCKCSGNYFGIKIYKSNNIKINYCVLSNNTEGIHSKQSNNAMIHYNAILDNQYYGINNSYLPIMINATYNWWGTNLGPFHPINNSNGAGDNVTDYVLFDPWLKTDGPNILTNDEEISIEDLNYNVKYSAINLNRLPLTWAQEDNASWLFWNASNYTLYGTPTNADVGIYWVKINVSDQLGDYDQHNFTLTILNVNPSITTSNNNNAFEDLLYYNDYNSDDDGQGIITWNFATDATWLNFNLGTGVLYGTPKNDDVGTCWVNVSVDDGNGGTDFTNFTLTVFNTNDPPIIVTTDIITTNEDECYEVIYTAIEIDIGDILIWAFESNATWLHWGTSNHTLYGTPSNENVGFYWVKINISDGNGGYDEHYFELEVKNVAPLITIDDKYTAIEDLKYINDYNCSDDNQGIITWTLDTNATWLNINSKTGVISGTPENSDVGWFWVSVYVDDGNGGLVYSNFTLIVLNTNDPPIINTVDVTIVYEDEYYGVIYTGTDIDIGDFLEWTQATNADWLHWGTENHTLYGIPSNEDVGEYWVRINIIDGNEGYDEHYFTLTVINVNDAPTIIDAPTTLEVNAYEDKVLDISPYINDVDNEIFELKLQTDSKYTQVDELCIIFIYPNSVSSENVKITVSDNIDTSAPHFILVTVNPKDIDPPTILEKSPIGTDVPINSNITITFSEPVLLSTVESAFSILPEVKGKFNRVNDMVIFDSDSNLLYNTTYTVTIDIIATDLAGNSLNNISIWDFTTVKLDTDSDGTPDDEDEDDDNDDFLDIWEEYLGTDPNDPNDKPKDTDSDGIPDGDETNSQPWMDTDDDNDSIPDIDEFTKGTNPLLIDTDGDGYDDGIDEYPLDSTKWKKEARPEDNIWIILIAIIIIVIVVIILIFLFVIKPRQGKKGKEKEVKEDEPRGKLLREKHQKMQTQLQNPLFQQVQPKREIEREPMDIRDLVRQGTRAYNEGRYEDAVIAWQQILEKEPDKHQDIKKSINDAVSKIKSNR